VVTKAKKDVRVAIIGSRGIPARYGGYETVVESIAPRLVEMGWNVFVSCESERGQSKPATYKGANLFYFPLRPFFRPIYEVFYDIYSLVKSSLSCDCIYMLGYLAAFLFFIPKVFGKKLAVNVDGLEWTRDKFNGLEKCIVRISEKAAVTFADAIIADSNEIKEYIEARYRKKAIYITYGVNIPPIETWNEQRLVGRSFLEHSSELAAGNYWLVVARLEPENNIHVITQSFLRSNSVRKLVIIGNFSSKKYQRHVMSILEESIAGGRVILPGAIYDVSLLNMLRQNCFAYIHGHSVGGTNPALLEAMSMKNLIVAHDNKFNREVGGTTILYFKDTNYLATKIAEVEDSPYSFAHLKEAAHSRVISNYSWHDIVEEYDKLFRELCLDEVTKKEQ
jgi:rhamnosyltransferase